MNPSTRLPYKRLGVAVLLGDNGPDQGQLDQVPTWSKSGGGGGVLGGARAARWGQDPHEAGGEAAGFDVHVSRVSTMHFSCACLMPVVSLGLDTCKARGYSASFANVTMFSEEPKMDTILVRCVLVA